MKTIPSSNQKLAAQQESNRAQGSRYIPMSCDERHKPGPRLDAIDQFDSFLVTGYPTHLERQQII